MDAQDSPTFTKKQFSDTRKAIKTGTWMGKSSYVTTFYGCNNCPLFNTQSCPHYPEVGENIVTGERKLHVNGICSDRALQMKDMMYATGNKIKLLQQDQLLRMNNLLDGMVALSRKTGKLPDGFHALQKNILQLLKDMRQQDEGMRITQDVEVTINELRTMIDVNAKKVEEEVQDADFVAWVEGRHQHNEGTDEEDTPEV